MIEYVSLTPQESFGIIASEPANTPSNDGSFPWVPVILIAGGLILTSALVYKLVQINSESVIQQHNETVTRIRKDIVRQDIDIAETNRKISTLESRRKVRTHKESLY
ncbi:MAG: hypothetical protein JST49_11735 [Bacteroidetes bacterium]|nr:hypothetical protein [Bacteroidota bacterium]